MVILIFGSKFDVIRDVVLVTFSTNNRLKTKLNFRRGKSGLLEQKSRLLDPLGDEKHQFHTGIHNVS